ncbi:MAG: acyltransferase family protein [Nitrospirales bacterium]
MPPVSLSRPDHIATSLPQSGYSPHAIRHDIQGLRALAISMVLLFHAGFPFMTGGYIGVDVFFVISGFLITRMLVVEKEKTGCINLSAFYARRIRRLLPAASVALVVTALLIFALYSPLEQSQLIRSFFASVVYLSNVWFAYQSTDYLGDNVEIDPFLHTWSLSVEEQFYLFWPLLILLLPINNRKATNIHPLIILVGSVFLISAISSLFIGSISRPWAFFASPFRAWEFAMGGLAFCIDHRKTVISALLSKALVSSGLSGILLAAFFYDKSTPFPDFYAFLPTLGTLLVLIGGRQSNWFINLSKLPWIRGLGDISYSLYLWHWPLIAIPLSIMGELSAYERLGCVCLSLILGTLSFRYIENPIRFNRPLSLSPMRGLALGIALTLFGVSLTYTLKSVAEAELQTIEQFEVLSVRSFLSKVYLDGCHLGFTDVSFSDCSYGIPASPNTLVLFGDSHAAQWFPALEKFSELYGYRLISLTKSACPSAHATPYNKAFGRPYTECGAWQNRVFERILQERPLLVILSNSSAHVGTRDNQISSSDWRKGMQETLSVIQESGSKTLIIRDTPRFPKDIPICLSRAIWTHTATSQCGAPISHALNTTLFTLDQATAEGFTNVRFLDFSDVLCEKDQCPPMINGHIGYKDTHHLALPTVQELGTRLDKELTQILTSPPSASSSNGPSMVLSQTEHSSYP